MHLYSLWNYEKTFDFLTISGGIEVNSLKIASYYKRNLATIPQTLYYYPPFHVGQTNASLIKL